MQKIVVGLMLSMPWFTMADTVQDWQKTFDEAIITAQKTKDSTTMLKQLDPMMNDRFNFPYMTAMAMGKTWRLLNPQEQAQVVPAFKQLLTRIYAKVIYDNRNSIIKVDKIDSTAKDQAVIYTTVNAPNNKTYKINYSTKIQNGKEQAYDVSVEGASLVTVYRIQFSELYRQKGAQGLIDELNAKNKAYVAQH